MICPACRRGLPAGPHDRCPFCATILAPPVEGALAPQPVTPAPRNPAEPLRELPGRRKRERTWKDEVRDRVQDRKQKRAAETELPLFPDEAQIPEPGAPVAPDPPGGPPDETEGAQPPRGSGPMDSSPTEWEPSRAEPREEGPEWSLGLSSPGAEAPRPVERPAFARERLEAGALDLGVLLGLWATVVYFASRTAHVPVHGLLPSWPYLAGYLASLGVIYAGYFTGTTGQTLGKMATGLHVVDAAGRPPGHACALLRAGLGSLGILLGGAGLLPILFDPARRALHDRVFKTRVIKR